MPSLIDLSGQRFGTFTVLTRAPGTRSDRSARWLALCDCGVERPARGDLLRNDGVRCWTCDSGYNGGHSRRRIVATFSEIIASESEFITECGCRIWTGDVDQHGYGKLYTEGRTIGAHRAAWIDERGPIPNGLWVLHRCDMPPCINVEHLFLGTQSDNITDFWAKRRRFERALAEQSHANF